MLHSVLSFDIGGTGLKTMLSTYTKDYEKPSEEKTQYYNDVDYKNFRNWIRANIKEEADILAISSAGYVDYSTKKIIKWARHWHDYDILKDLENTIRNCKKMCLLNDGEAHAFASFKSNRPVMVLSFGTSVGFGLITEQNEFLRDDNNINIDVGDIIFETSCSRKEIWYCCGHHGLEEAINKYGEYGGVDRFGYRIGTLVRVLYDKYQKYQPQTIVLTGGIIEKFGKLLLINALEELDKKGYKLNVSVNKRPRDSALIGIRNYSLRHLGIL